ncbi:copper-translocating P-type ATPase [Pseudomonas sp. ABC1]|uniref:heavy metal translocating P-type ATPase n=1 Tax=Pseudomonas sp. ABC1 TaxID=2748080 RepID=UPI0015C374C0|nr:heavy metal translocating P-type ATPase [Pseudomonas sp. ABC1]QLF92519.1 copper-translocating P-type ATPase [Pseudomonas sp. ABC1]
MSSQQPRIISFPIGGMTCAACASRIERVLNRLPGVAANVNFATEKAQVELSGEQTQAGEVIAAVRKSGFEVVPERVELAVGGMSCAACAARIEKVLNAQEGVSATVNFAAERAHVEYQPGLAEVDGLVARIEKAGFSASVVDDAARDAAKQRKQQEWQSLRWQFGLAALLTLPLMIEMVAMFMGYHEAVPRWLQWALATPVQFFCGRHFYRNAWNALRGGSANMDVLVALGTSVAYLYSVVVILAGDHHGHVYFEASAAIITLVLLGKLLEARAKAKTGAAIEGLLGLQPQIAHVEVDGALQDRAVASLRVGDIFVVRPGESIPLDGLVLEGASEINESMLTGESVPVLKGEGDKVFAATLNHNGALRVKASGVGSDTALARIVRLVEQAQGSKASVQRLADKVSAVFVPVVVAISVLTFLLGWWLTGAFTPSLVSAVAVLVIACPCALGLATPTAIMVGTGQGARNGILFRNVDALERAQQLKTLVVDKTGTLTEGRPSVSDLLPAEGVSPERLLALALGLERDSEHPLARALVEHASSRSVAAVAVSDFQAQPGRGLTATVEGQKALLGSPRFLAEEGVAFDQARMEALESSGKTAIGIALDGTLQGYIGFADRLREDAVATVAALQARGVRVVMLTGDSPRVAAVVAAQVKVDDFIAGVLPQHKAEEVERLKSQGDGLVGMLGDGINDAPALASADIGFAIGAGSDIALDTADVVLMRSQLSSLLDAIDLSAATLGKVQQNLFFAFIYNVLGIPLAAFGLLNPVVAGAAMALSSVSVLSNSLLLRKWKPAARQVSTHKH